MAKDYLETKNIKLFHQDEVLLAIQSHSNNFDSKSEITSILVFADKIDIQKNRVSPSGMQKEGLRQYQYIDDIRINILKDLLEINFVVNGKCNKPELESFYFTAKVFKAINGLAMQFNLKPKILYNGKPWSL